MMADPACGSSSGVAERACTRTYTRPDTHGRLCAHGGRNDIRGDTGQIEWLGEERREEYRRRGRKETRSVSRIICLLIQLRNTRLSCVTCVCVCVCYRNLILVWLKYNIYFGYYKITVEQRVLLYYLNIILASDKFLLSIRVPLRKILIRQKFSFFFFLTFFSTIIIKLVILYDWSLISYFEVEQLKKTQWLTKFLMKLRITRSQVPKDFDSNFVTKIIHSMYIYISQYCSHMFRDRLIPFTCPRDDNGISFER